MAEFNFQKQPPPKSWTVEPLIPDKQLGVLLAQAGTGKSLLAENLAVCVAHGVPFCGFRTVEGDALLIDQDTPTDTLDARLLAFGQALQVEQKYKLFVESMKGYALGNGTLISAICDHPTVRLVVIDCLHSVCGRLNPNYTSDMNLWAKVKERCLNDHNSILLVHHISQKWELDIQALMQGEANRLAMGSSAIIQQADSYYVVGSREREGRVDKLYARPVSKRVSIPLDPIVLRVLPTEYGELIEYEGMYEPDLDDSEYDIMTLFKEQQLERTVKEVYEAMGHKHGEKKVRQALSSLETQNKLSISRHRANLFKYRLPG